MVVTTRAPQKPGTTQLSSRPPTTNLGPVMREPASIEETGLDLNFIADLVLKIIYFNSLTTAQIIGGMVLTHQLVVTFDQDECPLVPDGHVMVV